MTLTFWISPFLRMTPTHCPPSSAADAPPNLRQTQRPALQQLGDMAAFAALLDRQLGHCRRYGARATVLLITADPQADGAEALAAEGLEALLKAVGARLLGRVRGSDVVSQIGERRFGLVLMDAGRAEADVVRARLHKALCGPYGVGEQRLYVALRMGAAVYREAGMTGSELAQAAEGAQRSADVLGGGAARVPLAMVRG
jgi:GGDEF domain-containing protein